MRAAVIDRYGPPEVVQVVEVPAPKLRSDEVLIAVRTAAVTSADARIRGANFPSGFGLMARLAFGVRKPRRPILGGSFSGEVVSVGSQVDEFAPGDRVAGMTGMRFGAHAEQVAVAAKRLTRLPDGVDHDQAAGVLFGGTTALYFLNDRTTVVSGASVLINGASGAIGTTAVQLAHLAGATVTAVTSAKNADLVTRLGADQVVDYHSVDVTELGERYDIVFDTVGNLTIRIGRPLLRDGGVLLLAIASLADTIRSRGNVVTGTTPERPEAFAHLLDMVANGSLEVVNSAFFDLDEISEAHRLVDSGRKVGNALVRP